MKTILCYGDSNTWGYNPNWKAERKAYWRYDWEDRWPGVLQARLGDETRVIEEGFGGRTLGVDDPVAPFRNGRTYFQMLLESHQPLSVVAIMLGTNDTKAYLRRTAEQIARDAEALVSMARHSQTGWRYGSPEVLLICPPAHHSIVRNGVFDGEFDGTSISRQEKLAPLFAEAAARHGAYFLDSGIMADASDGIHLNREAHRVLGLAVAARVQEILA